VATRDLKSADVRSIVLHHTECVSMSSATTGCDIQCH